MKQALHCTFFLTGVLLLPVLLTGQNINGKQTSVHSIVNHHANAFMRLPAAVGLSIGIYQGGRHYTYHFGNVRKGLPFTISAQAEQPGYTRSDFFNDLHSVTIDTLPGIKFKYSNAAAMLLGYVLENVYSKPFKTLIK